MKREEGWSCVTIETKDTRVVQSRFKFARMKLDGETCNIEYRDERWNENKEKWALKFVFGKILLFLNLIN